MKRILTVALLVSIFLISCGGESYSPPKELVFSETTYLYKVYYPKGWEATTGVNGSCTITYMAEKITIPFVIAVDENSKANNMESIKEFTDILSSSNPNGKTEIKKINGKKAMWWYFDVMGVELASFILPLDGVIVSAMIWASQSADTSTESLELARMIVDSFRLVN